MRKLLIINIFLWILFSCKSEINSEFPKWINELSLNASKILQTQVSVTHTKLPDNLIEGKYFMFCVKGKGSLEKVADPFEAVKKMFLSDGWKYVVEYQADGHGSSSFGYEKGNYFCNIFINIDSTDNDKPNHKPSKFWIEIYCREK